MYVSDVSYTVFGMSESHSAVTEPRIYWTENAGGGKGGIYYRAFDLVKFIEKVEAQEEGCKVTGIKIDVDAEGHLDPNIELIVWPPPRAMVEAHN